MSKLKAPQGETFQKKSPRSVNKRTNIASARAELFLRPRRFGKTCRDSSATERVNRPESFYEISLRIVRYGRCEFLNARDAYEEDFGRKPRHFVSRTRLFCWA
jgi:hypothetical protein